MDSKHLAFDPAPCDDALHVGHVRVGFIPVRLASPRLEPQFASIIALDLGRAPIALVVWRGFGRQATTLPTDLRSEAARDEHTSLRFEFGALVKLMRQKTRAEFQIACAHHGRLAGLAAIFPDQLVRIETLDDRVEQATRRVARGRLVGARGFSLKRLPFSLAREGA